LVIAFDAADPAVVLDLAGRGRMPNVAALVEQGVSAAMRNPSGCYVGATWPSLFTGVSPGRHGRFSPGYIEPGTYEVHRHRSTPTAHEPFWNALARAGRRTAVIDVPHAIRGPVIHGMHIVDWGSHDRGSFGAWPAALQSDVVERFGEHPVKDCDTYTARGALSDLRRDLLSGISRKADVCEFVLDQGGWDLFFGVFGESHCAGHQFWHLHDPSYPTHDRALAETMGDPLIDVYEALDAALGRVLTRVDDDAVVVLLLSHGMGPHYDGSWALSEILTRIDSAWGGASRRVVAQERLRRAGRRLTLRGHRRGPASADVERLLDGTKRFYRAPNSSTSGAIRINLRGREPTGRVSPERDYDEVCERLSHELLALVNLETGRPAVRAVVRTADLFDGPALARMPDLFVEWDRDQPIRSLASPTIGRLDGRPASSRSGDHFRDGFLVARGPSIRPGRLGAPIESTDVAPTLCALLAVELPGTGTPVTAIAAATGTEPFSLGTAT
jgi:predicted AlkP superfamily phosphohydrolase/phosphomutase